MSNIFEGQRIRLRAVEPEDWQDHYEWDKDSDMSRAVDYIWSPPSRARARQWAERESTKERTGDTNQFQIETLDGTHVGLISTHACNPRNGTFEYGLGIMPAHQRNGYAAEAIKLVLRYYFGELRYQKVTAHVMSFNVPSIRLHERLGFVQEGRLRRMVYTGGKFYDDIIFGMTTEEFVAQHPYYGYVPPPAYGE